jgi:alkylhydroperoxidase/carboxymuconolactone decarboxylase family protein
MSDYYKQAHLRAFPRIGDAGSPELASKFFDYYGAVFADGALTEREKALIALAVAHAVQCPYCIDAYTDASLRHGVDMDQITEAIHVATAIKGGAALVHGLQAIDAARAKGAL